MLPVILLFCLRPPTSSYVTTIADLANIPTNISGVTAGTFTQSGGAAQWLVAGLSSTSAPGTLPSNLNVTPTTSINIHPGGYQSVQGNSSPIALSIDTGGDSQMVAPINIGAGNGGYSLYVSGITQTSGHQSINLRIGWRFK